MRIEKLEDIFTLELGDSATKMMMVFQQSIPEEPQNTAGELLGFCIDKFAKMLELASEMDSSSMALGSSLPIPLGGSSCPLCWKYGAKDHCNGCPIASYTKVENCINTPYWNMYSAVCFGDFSRFINALKREISFLKEVEGSLSA